MSKFEHSVDGISMNFPNKYNFRLKNVFMIFSGGAKGDNIQIVDLSLERSFTQESSGRKGPSEASSALNVT